MYILFFLYLIILSIYFRSSIKQTYCKQILNYVLDVIKGFKYDFSFCFLFYLFSSSSLLFSDYLGPHHTIIKKYNQVNKNILHYFSVTTGRMSCILIDLCGGRECARSVQTILMITIIIGCNPYFV